MGPNLTDKSLQRAARTVSTVFQISKQFDKQSGVPAVTTAHSFVSDIEDVSMVVAIVLKEDILNIHPGRYHIKYRSMKLNPVPNLDKEKVVEWIGKKVKQFEKHNFFSESLEEVDDEESVYSDDEDSEGEVIEEYIPKYTKEACVH